MILVFAAQMYQAAEQEIGLKSLRIDVPSTPQICRLTHFELFLSFNSILLRYHKPVHPRPLAFIILLLEFF